MTDLPNSPAGLIRLMPATSDEVNRFANTLIQSVKFDGENPLAMLVQIRAMEKAFKIIIEKIQENVLAEADKYPENKFEFKSNFIEKSEFVTYDFSVCKDPTLDRLEIEFNSAKELLDDRKAFLKTLKNPTPIGDTSTGELTTVHPPMKKSVSGVKIFIK